MHGQGAEQGKVMLYQVRAPHFTAGVVTDDRTQTIVLAAPILRWAVGKPMSELTSWVISKRGTIVQADERHLKQDGWVGVDPFATATLNKSQESKP